MSTTYHVQLAVRSTLEFQEMVTSKNPIYFNNYLEFVEMVTSPNSIYFDNYLESYLLRQQLRIFSQVDTLKRCCQPSKHILPYNRSWKKPSTSTTALFLVDVDQTALFQLVDSRHCWRLSTSIIQPFSSRILVPFELSCLDDAVIFYVVGSDVFGPTKIFFVANIGQPLFCYTKFWRPCSRCCFN